MLILLRHHPDIRLQEVISSVVSKETSSRLVYLEHALTDLQKDLDPFVMPGITCSLGPTSCPSIKEIAPDTLLDLIRENPRILVLPSY
jgi:hypothetical protein